MCLCPSRSIYLCGYKFSWALNTMKKKRTFLFVSFFGDDYYKIASSNNWVLNPRIDFWVLFSWSFTMIYGTPYTLKELYSSFASGVLGVPLHCYQVKKSVVPQNEKMSWTLIDSCGRIKFLLWRYFKTLSWWAWGTATCPST